MQEVESMRQPKALYLIVCVQMWEYFSFYGMRVLLVLYMIHHLQFTDGQAFGIFALYTGLVEMGGIVGGIIADRLLGLRKAIFLGGWLIMSGHLTLALGTEIFFFPALALIIAGSNLFSTNLCALLGLCYGRDDPRREAGFTLYYAGVNLGALLASLLCGYIGDHYGWHYGFGLAAIGMLIGNLTFLFCGKFLEIKEEALTIRTPARVYASLALFLILGVLLIASSLEHESLVLPSMSWICMMAVGYVAYSFVKSDSRGVLKLAKLMLYILGASLFFAAEEQIGSSITLFSERHASKAWMDVPIPSSLLFSINPAILLLFGPLMNALCGRFTSGKIHFPFRIVIPFTLASLAFLGLAMASSFTQQPVHIALVMGCIFLISFAELMIGPVVYSICSESATPRNRGMVMGLAPIGFSLASAIGGSFSKWMAIDEASVFPSLEIYREGFMTIAMILLGAALLIGSGLLLVSKRQELRVVT